MSLIIRRTNRIKLFWGAFVALILIPTIAIAFLSYYKSSGSLARRIAMEISKQAGIQVSIDDIEISALDFSHVKLQNFTVKNPYQGGVPYLDASEVEVEEIKGLSSAESGSVAVKNDFAIGSITIRSYTISIPAGGTGGDSGQALRSFASAFASTFLEKRQVKLVRFERGRLLIDSAGGEILIGVANGEFGIKDNENKVTGQFTFDSLAGEEVAGKLDFVNSGTVSMPELTLKLTCSSLDVAHIEKNLLRTVLPDYSISGISKIAFVYKAGGTGKDYIEFKADCEDAGVKSKGNDSASAKSLSASLRYDSENSTFPNIEALFSNPFAPKSPIQIACKTTGLRLSASELGTFSSSSSELELRERRVFAKVEDFRGSISNYASFFTSKADLSITALQSGWRFATEEPISGVKITLQNNEISFVSLSCETTLLPEETAFDIQGKMLAGGSFDANGKFSILSPFPIGHAGLNFTEIPLVTLRSFLPELLPEWTVECAPIRGTIDATMKGADFVQGSMALATTSFTASNGKIELPKSRLSAQSDFFFEKASQIYRRLRLDYEALGSLEGEVSLKNGMLSSVQLEHSRLKPMSCAACLKSIMPEFTSFAFEGDLNIKGELSDFDASSIPKKANIEISIADELAVRHLSPSPLLSITGLTGSVAIVSRISDGNMSLKIDGRLLPLKVEAIGRRLFLSGQRVDLSGNLKIALNGSLALIDRIRVETEGGVVEELTGQITNLHTDPYFDLRFRDWGLTLEQLMSLVDVPEHMRFSGGVFTVERTIRGVASKLESKYKVTINGVNLDVNDIKVEGAGLILEFP